MLGETTETALFDYDEAMKLGLFIYRPDYSLLASDEDQPAAVLKSTL